MAIFGKTCDSLSSGLRKSGEPSKWRATFSSAPFCAALRRVFEPGARLVSSSFMQQRVAGRKEKKVNSITRPRPNKKEKTASCVQPRASAGRFHSKNIQPAPEKGTHLVKDHHYLLHWLHFS